MRAWWLVVVLSTTAFADEPRAQVCVPPAASVWSRCHKGSSMSEEALRQCLERDAAAPMRPARFRVDGGPWVTFSPDTRTCAAAPLETRFLIEVEHVAAWRTVINASTCPSLTLDVAAPNFYGAVTSSCTKR